jgi:carnitine monooxygenase subunit
MKDVLFGKNEKGGQVFHQWVERLVNASDDDLVEIFAQEHRQAAE